MREAFQKSRGGMSIKLCKQGEFEGLEQLWLTRGADSALLKAWKLDNPEVTNRYNRLKRRWANPNEIQGFHGTHPDNIFTICQHNFDSSLRSGQVYGQGEYFAKCPNVSLGYCKGGEYMLVCKLLLGRESKSIDNRGDHIWVKDMGYYVISNPAQILPLFIIKFEGVMKVPAKNADLETVLAAGSWTSKVEAVRPVPPNLPCRMSRESARVLQIGMLHKHLSDAQLTVDVQAFLAEHAPGHIEGLKVRIAGGRNKKALATLTIPMPRQLVHKLNSEVFHEGGQERLVCVEDAHGSPEVRCFYSVGNRRFCRGQNLRHTNPCWCSHGEQKTDRSTFSFKNVPLKSAKGSEIVEKFMLHAPFHNGYPKVVSIRAIVNEDLATLHGAYQTWLRIRHKEEPLCWELFHGTNNKILDVIYQHGMRPPSDCKASDTCPVSGNKGLCTTLCDNDCPHCVERHTWGSCHMFGLGIYLADRADKSHRYCTQPEMRGRKQIYRMIQCSVLGRPFTLNGHLRAEDAMHDVTSTSDLGMSEWAEKFEQATVPFAKREQTEVADIACEDCDLLFVQGLGAMHRHRASVMNSEYIAFHPHQCLPKYEIVYEI